MDAAKDHRFAAGRRAMERCVLFLETMAARAEHTNATGGYGAGSPAVFFSGLPARFDDSMGAKRHKHVHRQPAALAAFPQLHRLLRAAAISGHGHSDPRRYTRTIS